MTPHRYVVFGQWLRGFDTLEEARDYALANAPSVVCERVAHPGQASRLEEVMRHDFLYDEARGEWRYMLVDHSLRPVPASV